MIWFGLVWFFIIFLLPLGVASLGDVSFSIFTLHVVRTLVIMGPEYMTVLGSLHPCQRPFYYNQTYSKESTQTHSVCEGKFFQFIS